MTCHNAGLPQIGCRTLGLADFSRLPLPAARTTAVSVRRVVLVVAKALRSAFGTDMVAARRGGGKRAPYGSGPHRRHTISPSSISSVGASPIDRATAWEAAWSGWIAARNRLTPTADVSHPAMPAAASFA